MTIILTIFMQNKPNFKTEVSLSGVAIAKTEKQNTEDSKIMAKDTPNVFYNCRESSTNRPCFLQNKANLQETRMDVSFIITRNYDKKMNRTLSENKPNSNPIKANFRGARMSANGFSQRVYKNEPRRQLQENKPNLSTQLKTGQSQSQNRSQLVRRSPPTQRLVRRAGLGEDGKTEDRVRSTVHGACSLTE